MGNICNLFRERCADQLEKTFLETINGQGESQNISFGKMQEMASSIAGLLHEMDLIEGERIMVQAEKSPEYVALYLATLQIGAVFVPLNTAYTSAEVQYFVEDAEPRVFICDADRFDETRKIESLNAPGKSLLTLGNKDHPNSLEAKSADTTPFNQVVERHDDDLAAFLYTSGTTGRSKGAMLSHGNLSSNAMTLHQYWQFQPDDVLLHALPIFHVHGLFVALHCALLNASTVLFYSKYDAQQIIEGLPKATVMMGVPTFYTRLLAQKNFGREDCRSMRLFISGSAPMTEQVHRAWTERTDTQILERYGMTEAGMITSNPYDGKRLPGTVGYALPGVSVRVCDDQGKERPYGEVGTLEAKGPNVFQGYWKMPEKTAEEFREDGYFITGDLARMESDGRVSIVGRGKDLIITGGYNVYPKEIEMLIDEIDGVDESAVIGLPHADFGESVCALVVMKPDQTKSQGDIQQYLHDKLAKFKQPKEVIFVAELPRNSMGKVQKNNLRQKYADLFQ